MTAPAIPEGYTLLEGGPLRRLRVNQLFIHNGADGGHKPWRLHEGAASTLVGTFADVILLGETSAKAASHDDPDGCGSVGTAWIETTGPVAVKE